MIFEVTLGNNIFVFVSFNAFVNLLMARIADQEGRKHHEEAG